MSKELDKLIEQMLSEVLNIPIGTKVDDLRKALGSDSVYITKKTKDIFRKQSNSDVFDYSDTKSFTYSDIKDDSELIRQKKVKKGQKMLSPSSKNNVALMQIFLGPTVWGEISSTNKKKFKKEFFQLKNWGLLKRVPNFANYFPNDYKKILSDFQKLMAPKAITQKVVDDPSITSPNIQTGLGDRAEMTAEQKNYFDRFFAMNSTGTDLSTRLKTLTDFSLLIANSKGAKQVKNALKGRYTAGSKTDLMKLSQNFIVNIGILDMFNNFAKNIDHGAGAYYFETFLAYISGGQAGGKITGIAGGMGEADFLKADGTKGSAKYYQDGSKISQSWKNFTEGFPVEYVIAYKTDKQGTKTSDIEALYNLDIYRVIVEKTGPTEVSIEGNKYDLTKNKDLIDGDGQLIISKRTGDWNKIGTFIMPQTNKKTLTEFASEAAKGIDTVVEDTFKKFKTLLDDLRQLKTATQDYSTEPTITKGEDALRKSEKYSKDLKLLATNYGQTIKESNLSLDQLIESIIEEKLLK
tara:strand:- start:1936 stop:3498 length:1563 start_codon:yes stop_codon:yes gene_type:complete